MIPIVHECKLCFNWFIYSTIIKKVHTGRLRSNVRVRSCNGFISKALTVQKIPYTMFDKCRGGEILSKRAVAMHASHRL